MLLVTKKKFKIALKKVLHTHFTQLKGTLVNRELRTVSQDFIIVVYLYRVSQEERIKLRESVPYVKLYRYNPKHLYPKLNGYGDNDQRSLKI